MIEHSAVGGEPRCCLQDSPAAAFGPVGVVAGDFVLPARGGPGDISSNTGGAPRATSVDSPSRSADTPDRKRSSADDNPSGVGSGMRGGYKPVAEDDSGSVRRPADSSGNGECSSSSSGREWKGFILSRSASKPERASPTNTPLPMVLQAFPSVVNGSTSSMHRSVSVQRGVTIMWRNAAHKIDEIFRIELEIGNCWAAQIYVTIHPALQS